MTVQVTKCYYVKCLGVKYLLQQFQSCVDNWDNLGQNNSEINCFYRLILMINW